MKTELENHWHLRVSVLPQCNLRCRYCNPSGSFEKSPTLTDKEIIDVVRAAVANGICRVHWTGGEPCIRDMCSLIQQSYEAGMIQQIMTTNGTLRVHQIGAMKHAGLSRVNISLDTLNPVKFRKITGCEGFDNVKEWIQRSCYEFDLVTKMNIVPMRDNLGEVPDFIGFAQQFSGKLILKFIELCPNNPAFYERDIQHYAVNRDEIIAALERVGPLSPTVGIGDNPNAEFYFVGDSGVKVILVTMPSQNFKCGLGACRKMRISPYGLVGSCIQQEGLSLQGQPIKRKFEIIRNRMQAREAYSDEMPCSRRHFRKDYGVWRFGNLKECGK